MNDHTGQGFAMPAGTTYRVPDRDELAQRAARRESDERERRLASLMETEEGERRTLALAAANRAKVLEYRRLGGTRPLPPLEWGPEPDPGEDPFPGIDGNVERPA